MKNVVIIPNVNKDIGLEVTRSVIDRLSKLNINSYIESVIGNDDIVKATYYSEFPHSADLIIVIGGDGSVIDASKYAILYDIPIIGVNLGEVGYLSELEPNNLEMLDLILEGKYYVREKMLLSIRKEDGEYSDKLAVNDVVASHSSSLGISDFIMEDSLGNSMKYRADGIILSTPQGSTAYSLSAGGPVVAHDVDGILVSAVCPHSFFNRSVLFNASEVIKVTNIGDDSMDISIDGRYYDKLTKNESCYIKKADKKIKMLEFSQNSMFLGLFSKMKILEDVK